MKIHILNDIHIEFGKFKHAPPACDVVVLSGDVGVGLMGVEWAQETFDCPVIYVPGNHEFYGKKRRFLHHQKKLHDKAAGSNVHLLQNESVIIDGVRFIGTTLWTDFNLYGNQPLGMMTAQQSMNDYRQIYVGDKSTLTPLKTVTEHLLAKAFILQEMQKSFDGKTVVVTHHAPSELSVPPHLAGDKINPAYASRLEDLILDHQPVLWTHGHIHSSSDYMIDQTRVICNPRGYVGEHNPDFDPNLVIEI